ncbi:phage tail protein [Saccharibacillus sp. O16]|nr:phage tail protein [Saccharibacillus sp. O16]
MTYRTVQGDTWDLISYKVYETEDHMPLLMDANTEHARTVVFPANVVLQVPAKPAESFADLPPWKQVEL